MLGIISGMLGGEAVAKGRSPFAERVGEQIGSPLLTIVDDPTNPESLGAESYDDEGLATRRVPLLRGGVLEGFLHNSYSARRAGTVVHGVGRAGLQQPARRSRPVPSPSTPARATSSRCSPASTTACSPRRSAASTRA